jgi:lysophospholipase L1-like esterase
MCLKFTFSLIGTLGIRRLVRRITTWLLTASLAVLAVSSFAAPPDPATDWAYIGRYRVENTTLQAPAPGVNRVVFLGDSIVERWRGRSGTFLKGDPYLDRGISGQTTPQMLLRFRSDVISLNPKAVVIVGGTNDLAGKTGPESPQDIEGNLASMAQLAKANGIRVVLASILPVCGNHVTDRPPAQIVAIDKWLQSYCARNHFVYVDFYTPLVDDNGLLKRDLTEDCLHPNDAGYALMKPLALKAIDQALGGQ